LSKKTKLLERLLKNPKDLRFEELEKVILMCGYKFERSKGSHFIYGKNGYDILNIPRKTPVKSYLIKQVLSAVEDCIEELMEGR
jgi:predicted RNA binding protein YcfA (HicA-like mRNA interferase family)